MRPEAQVQEASVLLDRVLAGEPAERTLTAWGRRARYAGARDREAVRDLVFSALRRRRSCAFAGGGESGRALMLGLLRQEGRDLGTVFTGEWHAPAPLAPDEARERAGPPPRMIALDAPDWLWPELVRSLGAADAIAALLAQRDRAPVTVRVNRRKGTSEEALAALAAAGIEAAPNPRVPNALDLVAGARRLSRAQPYLEGLLEVQDAGSQAVVADIPLEDGALVLDYCAGGGGKTLALADRADAAFFAHDAAPRRMGDLPARAARASVSVTLLDGVEARRRAPYDLILADVPCSGSGTWRRAPEAKWALTPERLQALSAIQRDILDQTAPLLRPGGTLAYITCSLFAAENEAIVDAFLAGAPGWRQTATRRLAPDASGDGFYLALLLAPAAP